MDDTQHLGGLEGWSEKKTLAEMQHAPRAARGGGEAFIGDELVGDHFIGDDFIGDDFVGDGPIDGADASGAFNADVLAGAAAIRRHQRRRRRARMGAAGQGMRTGRRRTFQEQRNRVSKTGADVEFFNRPSTPAPGSPGYMPPGTPGYTRPYQYGDPPYPGAPMPTPSTPSYMTSYPGAPGYTSPSYPSYPDPRYTGAPGYTGYPSSTATADPARMSILRKWAQHRRRKHAAKAAKNWTRYRWHKAQMAALYSNWQQGNYRPRNIRRAARGASLMGFTAPRTWFHTKRGRRVAREKLRQKRRWARALAARAAQTTNPVAAAQLMGRARALQAAAIAGERQFHAAEQAAAMSGHFAGDEDRLGAAQAKEWESKVAADLAAKARTKANSGGISSREAALINMEADAHEAQSRLLGAEAKAICGETASSIMGNDDALGTWACVGRTFPRSAQKSPAVKYAAAAAAATPLGMKVRAGRKVAKMAQKDPRVRAKVKAISKKAKRGDPKAKRKMATIRAGKKADDARRVAQAREIKKLRKDAARKRQKVKRARVRIVRFGKTPPIFGRRIARRRRAKKLNATIAVVRNTKSKNPMKRRRAKKQVAFIHAAAKTGNPKAKVLAGQIALGAAVVAHTSKPSDKKRMQESLTLIREAKKGDPLAKQKIAMVQAAAEGGNPGAQKAVETLGVAAAAENFVSGKPTPLPAISPPGERPVQAAKPGMPAIAVPPLPGDPGTAEATASAAAALGIPAAAATGAIMKAQAGDPVARQEIDRANRLHEAARAGDPRAKAVIADAARGYKQGNVKKAGLAVALAAAVGIKKGKRKAPPAPPLRPHVPSAPPTYLPPSAPRGGVFSALIQLGPVPNSPFRRYYSGTMGAHHGNLRNAS
jgi:hypothetical protein